MPLVPSGMASARSAGSAPRGRRGRWFALGAAVLLTAVAAVSTPGVAAAAPAGRPSGQPDFGPNVKIFDPSMTVEQIQATVDAVHAQQVDNEMGTQRYTLLFKPGTYGTPDHPLVFQVGYYTEVAGLGLNPTDTVINGHVDVYNRCLAADNCIALVNFWRSLSNLTINVAGAADCRASGEFWAVSQAAPLRRVKINGNTTFMDYCTAGPQYASGGFIADSQLGTATNGSQQQFLVRDSNLGGWSNAVWNQVFSGAVGAPAQQFPNPPYTTLDSTPSSKERPYLYIDAKGKWNVFEPALRKNSSGASWANGPTPGRSVPLSDFYLAKPSDSVLAINIQLALGKHLLFTPGVYNINSSILVWRPDTIVLGMGIATLTAVNGAVPLWIADSKGISVSGIMIDAGTVNSPALMQVGTKLGGALNLGDANDPTVLHDVFFRVGGPHVGKADVSLEVNSDHVILDDIWAWRADHGVAGSVGWDVNTGRNGVIVNGDDVLATGLFVEHYQQYNVIWNGERGKTIFFQNELPYDPPNQAAWQHDGVLGWAAYKVNDKVKTHELWGGGAYIFTNVDPTIHAAHGFEVPNRPGVKLHDILTVNLSAGTIDHVVNDTGAPVATETGVGVPSYVTSYPAS
ncbi:adenylyl cyclase [Dactylosporangium sp. McL0621]|uniref:adenylyl cyclase n=1 Tax=Dactylosporangium sp. McL0621 TaxID=3415678 RepID=UPI003CEFEED4